MLIAGIALGLVLGLVAGGRLGHLATVRLRWIALLFGAVIVRFSTEWALGSGIDVAETLRIPLFGLAYAMLLVGLWANRAQPGISLAFVGVLGNALAILANGGYMPVWKPSLIAAGFDPAAVTSVLHRVLEADLGPQFLLSLGFLGDVIPVPVISNVASIGDVFLSAGLAFFLFATVVRDPTETEEDLRYVPERDGPRAFGRSGARVETGLMAGMSDAAALERPQMLGGSRPGMATPALAPLPPPGGGDEVPPEDLRPGPNAYGGGGSAIPATATAGALSAPAAGTAATGTAARPVTVPGAPPIIRRAARHPYVRLALNGSFSALWAGQFISLFGDRMHQIALGFLVFNATGSAAAVGLVFVAATLPNLLFSPLAGTLVDRWDHKEVLVVSDLLRAATVIAIPVAAVTNLLLVYPLIFVLTTISIFFRPARVAILPRLVKEDELLTANSAMWLGETLADVVGYPLAGLFVAFLGAALPLAFWLDGATYVASAILLASIVVPAAARRTDAEDAGRSGFLDELRAGWAFLRGEATLLANTLQATVAQFTVGILTALTLVYATETIRDAPIEPEAVYAFLETAIGVGNLLGGFALGLLGARLAKGRTVILGYTAWGLCTAGLALTGNFPAALGLMFGSGVANMVFVIPSQTLFQERTPPELMGRVVGFRFALVFGSMTLAMAVGGILGEAFGVAPVLAAFGLLTAAAGLAGLFVPAVRDA